MKKMRTTLLGGIAALSVTAAAVSCAHNSNNIHNLKLNIIKNAENSQDIENMFNNMFNDKTKQIPKLKNAIKLLSNLIYKNKDQLIFTRYAQTNKANIYQEILGIDWKNNSIYSKQSPAPVKSSVYTTFTKAKDITQIKQKIGIIFGYIGNKVLFIKPIGTKLDWQKFLGRFSPNHSMTKNDFLVFSDDYYIAAQLQNNVKDSVWNKKNNTWDDFFTNRVNGKLERSSIFAKDYTKQNIKNNLEKNIYHKIWLKLKIDINNISIKHVVKQFDGKKEIVVIVIIKNYGPTLQATLRGFKQI